MDDLFDLFMFILLSPLVLLVIFFSILGILRVYDSLYYAPNRAQDALIQCQQRGFDSYETFSGVIFSDSAKGVKCNYIKNHRSIDVNNDNVMILS